MFDYIIQQAKKTEYDFRKIANPDDPLAHLFSEWVDYYKLKWAIAHVLKPASILEIGVRFGYSAAAFLNGNPAAHYVGIDLDTDSFGGVKGAIHWAEKITTEFSTEFLVADTQTMQRFPHDIYDLIHVDGQQDGDGSFHDLTVAIKQGRYVLVDGYLWTQQNFLAVSSFLFRYADILDWYGVIPGYAGELLIKVSEDYLRQYSQNKNNDHSDNSSLAIRQTYTTEYYTEDCGGYDVYKKNHGKKLEDPRLRSVATIASLKKIGRVLDLGCGRGELSYYFARKGFTVTAVDYSDNAIELAKKCFDGEENLKANVQFICDDVCRVSLSENYDLVVASDVIEHLSREEVDKLYYKTAQHLKSDGLFVVHTFPNLWYYKYDYQRKRRIAASVGGYLPPEPRSRYEMLMHINEQSPRVLKKQLSQYFKYVYLWFAHIDDPGGSLVRKFSRREMCAAPSLFAIASHRPIDQQELKSKLQISVLPPIPTGKLKIFVKHYPTEVRLSSEFEIQLEIENKTEFSFHSYGSHPVHIAYHWMDEQATHYIVFDGERTKIFPPLDRAKPIGFKSLLGQTAKETYLANIKSLPNKGNYILRVSLVQEGVRWFDTPSSQLMEDILISIM